MPRVNAIRTVTTRTYIGKTSKDSVIKDRCSGIITQPRFVIDHTNTAEQCILKMLSNINFPRPSWQNRTFVIHIVLLYTWDPGDPNRTIPPSVGACIILFLTMVFWQLMLIPSAHCWYKSVPQGPMSLFCTRTLLQAIEPSKTWRQDQLLESKDRTNSTVWFLLFPPITMLAPTPTGVEVPRAPSICWSTLDWKMWRS